MPSTALPLSKSLSVDNSYPHSSLADKKLERHKSSPLQTLSHYENLVSDAASEYHSQFETLPNQQKITSQSKNSYSSQSLSARHSSSRKGSYNSLDEQSPLKQGEAECLFKTPHSSSHHSSSSDTGLERSQPRTSSGGSTDSTREPWKLAFGSNKLSDFGFDIKERKLSKKDSSSSSSNISNGAHFISDNNKSSSKLDSRLSHRDRAKSDHKFSKRSSPSRDYATKINEDQGVTSHEVTDSRLSYKDDISVRPKEGYRIRQSSLEKSDSDI